MRRKTLKKELVNDIIGQREAVRLKKILLSKEKNFYKANLHCHSTVSDGSKTPAELKEMYMHRGYSIIAYTDHDIFVLNTSRKNGH